MNWKKQGIDPDYRFSLANERTYLAWIRTALAILAGSIVVSQLTVVEEAESLRQFLVLFLCVFAALISVWAYYRWTQNEKAMRHQTSLTYSGVIKYISFGYATIALLLTFIIFR